MSKTVNLIQNKPIYSQDKISLSKTNCFICNCKTDDNFPYEKYCFNSQIPFHDPWGTGKIACCGCVSSINKLLWAKDEDHNSISLEDALKIYKKNIKDIIEINTLREDMGLNIFDINQKFDIIDGVKKPIIDKIINNPIMKNISDTNFRLNSKSVFLTYKHHIPFNDLINFIDTMHPILEYVICHENSDKNDPYLHTHATIKFKYTVNITNCRKFDYSYDREIIHPNIKTTRDWVASCEYLLKQARKTKIKNWFADFDVEELLKTTRNKYIKKLKKESYKEPKPGDIAEQCIRIGNYKNSFEAIQKEASSLKDVMAINMIYNNKQSIVSEKQINYLKELFL